MHGVTLPRITFWIGAVLLAVGLTYLYTRVAWTVPMNSDDATLVLQGRDLMDGNLLLHGWTTGNGSFYLTDVVPAGLATLVKGISESASHLGRGLTYAAAMLAAMIVASGRRLDGRAVWAMAITFALAAAPADGAIDLPHIGGSALILVAAAALDGGRPSRGRWIAYSIAVFLGATSDPIVPWLIAGGVAFVVLAHVWHRRELRFAAALAAVTVAVLGLGKLALLVLAAAGASHPATLASAQSNPAFAELSQFGPNLTLAIQNLLLLFRATFLGQSLGIHSALGLLHMAGLVLVVVAVGWTSRRMNLGDPGALTDLLLAGVVVTDLLALLLSTLPEADPTPVYLLPPLFCGSALAGRWVSRRIDTRQVQAVAAAVVAVGLVGLAATVAAPRAAAPADDGLVQWLEARHLSDGLGYYWDASVVTVASQGAVAVRPIISDTDGVHPFRWEYESDWFDGAQNPTFVVFQPVADGNPAAELRATFGPPLQTHQVGPYVVFVYNHNLSAVLTG